MLSRVRIAAEKSGPSRWTADISRLTSSNRQWVGVGFHPLPHPTSKVLVHVYNAETDKRRAQKRTNSKAGGSRERSLCRTVTEPLIHWIPPWPCRATRELFIAQWMAMRCGLEPKARMRERRQIRVPVMRLGFSCETGTYRKGLVLERGTGVDRACTLAILEHTATKLRYIHSRRQILPRGTYNRLFDNPVLSLMPMPHSRCSGNLGSASPPT